jgi:hypothetical protein
MLIAQEFGDDRDFEVFALVGQDGRPEKKQPQERRDTPDNRDESQNNRDDPNGEVQGKCLDRVEFDEGPVLLPFNEKHDKCNDKDRVPKSSPEFIIAGYVSIHFLSPLVSIDPGIL